MLDMILREAQALPLEEKRRLVEGVRALIAEEASRASLDGSPSACPRCGSPDFIRKGHGSDGRQRWKCKACGRTFSARTGLVIANSKLGAATWQEFAERTLAGGSLRECARACHVCLRTSWFMRMRLFEVMRGALQPFRTGETVSAQVDGLYLDESLTGNHGGSRTRMPRRRHAHGHAEGTRGISGLKVCVECAANDLGDEFARVCSRGRPTDAQLEESLSGIVDGSWVSSDEHAAYYRVLPRLGAAEHVPTNSRKASHGELGLVNSLHQRLREFLAPFHSVSTKWLERYLWFFMWAEQARRSEADGAQTLSGQLARGTYGGTRRALIDEPQPIWDYWEAKSARSTVV